MLKPTFLQKYMKSKQSNRIGGNAKMRKLRRMVVHNKMYNRGLRRVNKLYGLESYFSKVWREYK